MLDVASRWVAGIAVLGVAACMSVTISYGEEADSQRVARFAQAGEFVRAIDLAKNIDVASDRNQAFQNIAQDQLEAGLWYQAIESSSYIDDDLLRSNFLGDAAQHSPAARGGGVQPNFDELLDLITTTVEPESWEELGGPGSVAPFSTGVYVDAEGTLNRIELLTNSSVLESIRVRSRAADGNLQTQVTSPLRKVSLNRLEKEIQLAWAAGKKPTEAMKYLAGIYKFKYLLIYPEKRDIVLAGPAGAWGHNAEGRIVNQATGRPVLHLDDLVVMLRNAVDQNGKFGCAITPTQTGLKDAKTYLETTSQRPLHRRQRNQWLEGLRTAVGKQVIDVHGIPADTRAGRIIVEADYHMKRIGMGLEDGTAGVPSYLEMVSVPPGGKPQPMDVLRWWFTLNYQSVQSTAERNAFGLQGSGVRVLSENEMIDAQGKRIHTNQSSQLNATFARNFTQNYDALCVKYPVYAEMKNIFDLALVAGLIEKHRLADRIGWHMTHFGPGGPYVPQTGNTPKQVESIMNMRVIDGKDIIAGVSGGVDFDASLVLKDEMLRVDDYGLMENDLVESKTPDQLEHHGWWWD